MHQLGAWALTSDRETLVKGIARFRNAKSWTDAQRHAAIEHANAIATILQTFTKMMMTKMIFAMMLAVTMAFATLTTVTRMTFATTTMMTRTMQTSTFSPLKASSPPVRKHLGAEQTAKIRTRPLTRARELQPSTHPIRREHSRHTGESIGQSNGWHDGIASTVPVSQAGQWVWNEDAFR